MPFFFDHYPYTNFHNINLDWVLEAVKAWGAQVENLGRQFNDLKEVWYAFKDEMNQMIEAEIQEFNDAYEMDRNQLQVQYQQFTDYVTGYLNSLDYEQVIHDNLQEMANNGQLNVVIAPTVANVVSEWLETNVTPTTPIIDNSLSVSGAGADSLITGDKFDDIGSKGNNLLKLTDKTDFRTSGYGNLQVTIHDNRITIIGTTSAYPLRLKLTNGYDLQVSEQDSWASETLDLFDLDTDYYIYYKIYSGSLPSTVGTPARVSKTPSISFLSGTVPRNKATTSTELPHYIMLYIPINTTLNVTFEPFFCKGYASTDSFKYNLRDSIKINNFLIPEKQFTYFDVTINKTIPNTASNSTSNNDTVVNQTVKSVVTFPVSYSSKGTPTPLIMFCHGRTDRVIENDWCENDTDKRTLIESFTSAGYAVFDVDALSAPSGGAVDVGCPALMQAYIKAWEYVREHYNVEDKLFIFSLSFGTFAGLNMLEWYPTLIKTACLTAMRTSLEAVFDRGEPYNTEIAQNFGFASSTTFERAKVEGFDSYGNIVNISNTDYLFKQLPPIKAFTSSGDTLELNESHTFINALKNSGNYVNYREVANLNHHAICYLTNAGLRTEVINWFNRYK